MRHRKPCPGCGEADRYREGEKVCGTCARRLATAIAEELRQEKLAKKKGRFFTIPNAPHNLPYIPYGDDQNEFGNDAGHKFQNAFCGLIREAFTPAPTLSYGDNVAPVVLGRDGGFNGEAFEMSADAADHLAELYAACLELGDGRYREGFANGQNILKGLAEGSMSVDDAAETAAKAMQRGKKAKR